MTDHKPPTEQELERYTNRCLHGSLNPEAGLRLIAEVRRLRAAKALLQDWEDTPGNMRNAAWWHQWEDKRKALLPDELDFLGINIVIEPWLSGERWMLVSYDNNGTLIDAIYGDGGRILGRPPRDNLTVTGGDATSDP